MIRRPVLVAAAAAAMILVPSAAMADYSSPTFPSTTSDSSPGVGQTVTFTVSGLKAGEVATLSFTSNGSTKSFKSTANASGVATFSVSFPAAGMFTVTIKNASGTVLSTQTITVAGTSTGTGTGAGTGTGSGSQLSFTGFDGTGLAVGGGVLVLAGAGAVVVARRRKSPQSPA